MLNCPSPRVKTPEYQHYTGMKAWITLPAEDPDQLMWKWVTQSCPYSLQPLGLYNHGILQARIRGYPFPLSSGWLRRNVKCLWKEKPEIINYSPVTNFLKWGLSYICIFSILFSPWVVSDSLQPPWMAAHQAFPVLHYLLQFAQIHVCWACDAIFNPHFLWCPLLFA